MDKIVNIYHSDSARQIYDNVDEYEARQFVKARVAKILEQRKSAIDIELKVSSVSEARQAVKKYRKQQNVRGRFVNGECWSCGTAIENIGTTERFYCFPCSERKEIEDAEKAALYDKLRYEQLIERAMLILEKQKTPVHIRDYRKAYENILEYENGVKVFDSAHEVVTYMELCRCGTTAIPNFNIKRYRADFSLPDEKIILEIDGHLHKTKTVQDEKRDREIRAELGDEWEVVRIPTEYVEQNIKQLLPAARKIKEEMQKLRRLNNGELPEYFSQRQRDKKQKK